MKNVKFSALVLIIMLALPTMNQAQTETEQVKAKPCKQMCEKRGFGPQLGELNLSDDQKQKVEKLQLEHQKKVLPLRNQLGEKNAHLRTLTTVDAPDTKAINLLVDEIGNLKTQLMKERVNFQLQIRSLLTEEQRLRFDMDKPGCGLRGEGRGKGMGQGMGMVPDMEPGEDFDEDMM